MEQPPDEDTERDVDSERRGPPARPHPTVVRMRAEMARQDALREAMPRRPGLRTVMALVLGAVFGAVGTLTWQVHPSARTITGIVGAIDDSGSAVLLSEPAEMTTVGLGVVGVLWRDSGTDTVPPGDWQRTLAADGFPTCLAPGDVGRSVTLGLVTDPGGSDRPPSQVVAWLECGPPSAAPPDPQRSRAGDGG